MYGNVIANRLHLSCTTTITPYMYNMEKCGGGTPIAVCPMLIVSMDFVGPLSSFPLEICMLSPSFAIALDVRKHASISVCGMLSPISFYFMEFLSA